MRLSAVVLGSLLGMGSSSAAVAWMTADAARDSGALPSSRASVRADSLDAVAADPSEAGQPVLAQTPSDLTVAAPADFTREGTVRLRGSLGHTQLPTDRAHETYVLVEVGAPADAAVESRAPVNLSVVIDRSGSMKGQRLTNAIAAAKGMIARLRPDDTVSLIAYHQNAELLMAPTRVDRIDPRGLDGILSGLRGRGHTCISCGIDLARAQIRQRSESVNRILLLSDGVANRGVTRVTDFRALGDRVRDERTAIASVGVDVDYDERGLFALSQASNGRHYFVENPSALAAVFDREAQDLAGTVADRVDVAVQLAEGVELLEVIARGHRRRDDGVSLSFGTLQSGEERSALLRVRVDPTLGDRQLASVHLAYRELGQQREERSDGTLGMRFDARADTPPALEPAVEERLARSETLDALLLANDAFANGDVDRAKRALSSVRSRNFKRRSRAVDSKAAPKISSSYTQQLEALEQAEISFDEAAVAAPRPAAASKSRQGKKAIRLNAEAADPFG